MGTIDLSTWKSFVVGDIFPNIVTPKVYHTREVTKDDEGIPYVVRSKFNNGLKYRVKKDGLILNPAGVISYGAENSQFFYQKEEYVSGRDMYYIDTRFLTKESCLFVCACLNTLVYKYSYNFGLFPKLLKKEKIFLPCDESGNPDWEKMAHLIAESTSKFDIFYNQLTSINHKKRIIDVSTWKKYIVGDLLDCQTTTPVMPEEVKDGNCLYITRSAFNNGCSGHIAPVDNKEVLGNCITIGAEGKIAFYQPDSFYPGIKVYTLRHERMNREIGLFLCTILNANAEKYSYKDARILAAIQKEEIFLPSNRDNPDWDYMEDFIKKITVDAKNSYDNLVAVGQSEE